MDALSLLRRFCETSRLREVRVIYSNGGDGSAEEGATPAKIVAFGRDYVFDARAPTALLDRKKQAVDLESCVVFAQYFLLVGDGIHVSDDDMTVGELQECRQRSAEDAKKVLTSSWKLYLTKTTRTKLTRVNRLDVPSVIDYLCGTTTIDKSAAVHAGLISIEAPLTQPIDSSLLARLVKKKDDIVSKATVSTHATEPIATSVGGTGIHEIPESSLTSLGKKRKAHDIEDIEDEEMELRKRERVITNCEGVLLCRKGKSMEKTLQIELECREWRAKEAKLGMEVRQKISSVSKEERAKQQQLKYDKTRKQKMVQGAGKNRFDDVDEKVYYKNAIGTTADIRIGGVAGISRREEHNGKLAGQENEFRNDVKKDSNNIGICIQPSLMEQRRIPIILVPAGFKTIITKLNAKHFLEEGKYIPNGECTEDVGTRSGQCWIQRSLGRKTPVIYEVRDKAPPKYQFVDGEKKRNPEWNRVVAVFVLGAKWQFKEWPFVGCDTGDMVQAFSRIKAFHIHFSNDNVKPDIKKWNVKTLDLERNSRYKDLEKAQEFWKELDAFMGNAKDKLNLKY